MMTQPVNVSKKTEDLLASFQQYGYELLKKQNQEVCEALKRRHINTDNLPPLEEAYTISCRLSSLIPLEQIKEQILQKINEVVYCIKDFKKVFGIDKILTEYGCAEQSKRKTQFLNNKIGDISNFNHNLAALQIHTAILAFLKATVNEEKLGVKLEKILKDQDKATLVQLLALF